MTKKERQEHINYIQDIVNENIEFDKRKEELVLGFIFNILTNNTVMNRYSFSKYGNIDKDELIGLTECINYIYKKLEENKDE